MNDDVVPRCNRCRFRKGWSPDFYKCCHPKSGGEALMTERNGGSYCSSMRRYGPCYQEGKLFEPRISLRVRLIVFLIKTMRRFQF